MSRRPDALFNPQFYAEDGAVWFADAWNLGFLHSLTLPAGGYLNTLPRLVGGLAILVPLKSAPLLLNCFGIAIQALPVSILLSTRCANWGPLWLRGLQAALYIALPNSSEINVAITNAHFHLAVSACLLAFSQAPSNIAWKSFDVLIFLLTGLTGPWSLILIPLLLVFWWRRRNRWSLAVLGVLALCAAIQSWELLQHIHVRPGTPLGASFNLFVRIISGQVYAAAIWGRNSVAERARTLRLVVLFSWGTGVLLYALATLRLEMKLFIIFALGVTAAALANPLVDDAPRWHTLALGGGARYWIFVILALFWSLTWLAFGSRGHVLQICGIACLVVTLRGIRHDWRHEPYKDKNFGAYVRQFDLAAPGTRVVIPLYPGNTAMMLIKKAPSDDPALQ